MDLQTFKKNYFIIEDAEMIQPFKLTIDNLTDITEIENCESTAYDTPYFTDKDVLHYSIIEKNSNQKVETYLDKYELELVIARM